MTSRDRAPDGETVLFGDAASEPGEPPPPTARYDDLGLIGIGGMGEVRRVRDHELNRVLAMKIIREDLLQNRSVVARFVEEAQATAQLEHPGIVPVHDFGRFSDGRWFFTMKEVKGQTFGEVIAEVHASSTPERWGAAASGWTFHRLIDAFRRVCEAVAHAHARGVIHRDLKPANVMVGAYGEVLVLDWGLAKVLGRRDEEDEPPKASDLTPVSTQRSIDRAMQTRMGTVAGTPTYMSPEQARGQIGKLDARSDVWSLGAILYEILSGRAPYEGETATEVLELVRAGGPDPVPATPKVPVELAELVGRAMSRDPDARFGDAGALAAEVGSWQEGAHKRERALQLVAQAEAALPEGGILRERAAKSRREAARLLDGIRAWEPVDKKKPAWELESAAIGLEAEADLSELRVIQHLQGALTHVPDLPEAHALLADLYRERHATAEARRDRNEARRNEVLLATHDTGRHAGYLRGDGRLSLVTDPPAEVELFQLVERDRRLVPERVCSLGKTPLTEVALSMGSYLLLLRAPGREEVRYPVSIGREQHWDGVRPGEQAPRPIRLPLPGELGPDDVYVPAGWFWCGGDPEGPTSLPRRRLWVDGFVIRRFQVTNAEYLEFLSDLVSAGRADEASRYVPRERSATGEGKPIYGVRDGRWVLVPDADGDVWQPDWPVLLVDWWSADAFARWTGARTGQPWRLVGEIEWEKAGRGTDARFLPWGDFFDATWACVRDSHPRRMLPASVRAFPVDESPYGVRGMAGNAQVWCADVHRLEGPFLPDGIAVLRDDPADPAVPRSNRGAGWSSPSNLARLAHRRGALPTYRSELLGIRLARPWG